MGFLGLRWMDVRGFVRFFWFYFYSLGLGLLRVVGRGLGVLRFIRLGFGEILSFIGKCGFYS